MTDFDVTEVGAIKSAEARGYAQGVRDAAKWHHEVADHDAQGMEYSSLVGIPIANWGELDMSVKTHTWCEQEILALLPADTAPEDT